LFLIFTIIIKIFTQNLTVFSLLYCQISASVVALFIVFFLKIRHFKFGMCRIEWVIQLFLFGRYGMGTNLASMIFQRADILILGSFVSPASLAVYNVATRIITYLDFPLNQLGLALLPKMASQVSATSNNKGQITEEIFKMYEKTVASLLALTLPMTLGAFFGAKILVVLLAGSAYQDAAPLLQIMLVASVVKPFGRVFGILLDAIGKPDWNFKMLIISMVVTLFFNLLLIQPHILGGTEGAAWASALSVIITIVIGQMVLIRHFPIRFQAIFSQILPTYKFILKQRF
jgi:O-antigen/teichoic acid export membrane protein